MGKGSNQSIYGSAPTAASSGRPEYLPFWEQADREWPEYESIVDPATGQLKSQYQFKPEQLQWNNVDTSNAWERNMLEKQNIESQRARDVANAAASSGAATARSNLAMRGGLGGGAAERIAQSTALQGLMAAQNQAASDQTARLGISAEAANKQIDDKKWNAEKGFEAQKYNVGSGNEANLWGVKAMIADQENRSASAMERYKAKMQGQSSYLSGLSQVAGDEDAMEAYKNGAYGWKRY